jgi:hypothetical protein
LPNSEAFEFARTLIHKAEQDELVLVKLFDDPEVSDEILGYHLQQAVEKRLKAVLALNGIDFKWKHNMSYLTTLLEKGGVELPPCREQIEDLTPWASDARYEGFFEGELDRAGIAGLCQTMIGWSTQALGDMDYLTSSAHLLQTFAREVGFDHVALLVERENERGVLHITVDGSAWAGSMDELLFTLIVHALDFGESEPQQIDESGPKLVDEGLGMLTATTLEGLDAKQAVLLVRWSDDYSFSWWHADRDRVVRAQQVPNSMSKVLLDINDVADTPLGQGDFEKPDPDVRFSRGMVQFSDQPSEEGLVEILDLQREAFREKFGRDPGPEDPVFFDPEADEPRPPSQQQIEQLEAIEEEIGVADYVKRSAREALRTGMAVPIAEAQAPSPFERLNFAPLFLTLVHTIGVDGDLKERCLYAVVHCWGEGHLAAPGHPHPSDTDSPLHVPPFPDPEEDAERIAVIVNTAIDRSEEGGDVATLGIAAALGWEAGWRQGKTCSGCAIEGSDSPFATAMRTGRMGIGFQPLIERPEDSPGD